MGLLWPATIGFFMQLVIDVGIESYAHTTGETTVTGFSRFWKS